MGLAAVRAEYAVGGGGDVGDAMLTSPEGHRPGCDLYPMSILFSASDKMNT